MMFTNIDIYMEDIDKVLKADFPWSRMNDKNILITGATGLIGSFLTDVLMANPARKYHVWICSRNKENAKKRFATWWDNPCFHFFEQDLNNSINNDTDFHYIFHTAGNSYPAAFANDPIGTLRGTIMGTDNLLRYSLSHKLERMVYVSSGEVYGDGDVQSWSESDSGYVDPTSPRSCYPTAKRAAENLCSCYCSQFGLDICTVRPSHTYGATFTNSDNRAYAQFIRNAVKGEDIVLKSDGLQVRGYCYVSDCISAMLYTMFYGTKGEAYNISNENSLISIKELANLTAAACNTKVIFQIPDDQERKGYSIFKHTELDNTKIKALGWKPQTSIQSGIARSVEILRKL